MFTYDAIKLMKHASDMVPDLFVLNVWLKTDILSPTQRAQVKNPPEKAETTVRPAEHVSIQSACFSESEARVRGESKAKEHGERSLNGPINNAIVEVEPAAI